MIRLFVIDDHPIVIDGLNYLFHLAQDDIRIVGSALNVHEAVCKVKPNELDIFILDLYIPDSYPPDNVRTLKKKFTGKKIIIFTTESSYLWVRAMIKEGVDAYLTKDLSDSQVKSAIYKVFNGESVFPFVIAEKHTTPGLGNHECDYPLQSNQQKIIQLLINGLSVKQIADVLGINIFKTNYLLKKTRQQFKVKNNVELIATLIKQRSFLIPDQQNSPKEVSVN